MELNQNELIEYFGTTLSTIKTNFPKFKAKQLEKGYLITKRGKGDTAIYEVEKVTPEKIDPSLLSTQPKVFWEKDAEGEKWVTTYCNDNFEVSNFGRVRCKQDLSLRKPSARAGRNDGYQKVSIQGKNYSLNRLVLISFNPIENYDLFDVDHLDGNRSNNHLDNLRWATSQENTQFMLNNRRELNLELTRLLSNHSYNEVLNMLKALS